MKLGPESRKLALVMVGLPARGKSFTARRIDQYLSWLGHRTRVFNVGEYRRREVGAHVRHDFFDPDNREGGEARRQMAALALNDMLEWLEKGGLEQGGDVAIYDATNTTVSRRAAVRTRCAQAGVEVVFVELVCNDPSIIAANIRNTKLRSPDYADRDPEEAVADFRARISHYERAYEPVHETEGPYLKLTDLGRSFTARNLESSLSTRVAQFLLNLHLKERPVLLTRHGESEYNQSGLLGGDPPLSALGQQYAAALANHLDARFPDRHEVVVFTSSLQRAIQTGAPLGRDARPWRALDEIHAGVCEGMTYARIKQEMPVEFSARKGDKLNYRYPRGESYHDVIQRLDPVVLELERAVRPVLVIAHNAVIRTLYAYFREIPRARCPHIEIPLHTLIELRPHSFGCDETQLALL